MEQQKSEASSGLSKKEIEDGSKIAEQILKEESYQVAQKDLKLDPNAVFVEFNPQIALEKLVNIEKGTFAERISYTRHLAELIGIIGEEGFKKLPIILKKMADESDPIKKELLTQLTPLVNLLKPREKGYSEIRDTITPVISKLLSHDNLDMKEEAGEEMSKLAFILNEEDRGKFILTTVLSMAHDDNVEENRIVAVQLLSRMAPAFGRDLCEQFVGLEFLSLGEDPQIRVRKEAIGNLTIISRIVSHQFFKQRLFPFFTKLTDDNVWVVRKACVDNFVEISQMCEPEVREQALTNTYLKFFKDINKWVKISAYKNLGPFISTLAGLNISNQLLDYYSQMTENTVNNLSNDNEIIISCAYNFPAVLQAFGANRWPQLSKIFHTLIKKSAEVKKPLSCAIHEIAKIIGPEKAEKDLFIVLESFLKDQNDEVKYGVIKNLSNFLQVFENDKRENLVDVFLHLQKDPKKWRIRELIAEQIDKLSKIYNTETVFRIIAPISFKLCSDAVSMVRETASRKIHTVLLSLYEAKEVIYRECIIENMKGFSHSLRYNQRQAFVYMCEGLMDHPDIFNKYFLDSFKAIAKDRVPNVRISVAKILQKFHKDKKSLASLNLLETVEDLKNDKVKDVVVLASQIRFDSNEDVNSPMKKVLSDTNNINEKTKPSLSQKIEPKADKEAVDSPNEKMDAEEENKNQDEPEKNALDNSNGEEKNLSAEKEKIINADENNLKTETEVEKQTEGSLDDSSLLKSSEDSLLTEAQKEGANE